MTRFEAFVDDVVRAMPADRREAVREELLDHLVAAREAAIEEGMSEPDAIERALASLGTARRLRRSLFAAEWKSLIVDAWPAIVLGITFAGAAQALRVAAAMGQVRLPWWPWISQLGLLTPVVVWTVLVVMRRLSLRAFVGLTCLVVAFGIVTNVASLLWTVRLVGSDFRRFMQMWLYSLPGIVFTFAEIVAAQFVGGRRVQTWEAVALASGSRVVYVMMGVVGLAVAAVVTPPSPNLVLPFVWGAALSFVSVLMAARVAPIQCQRAVRVPR